MEIHAASIPEISDCEKPRRVYVEEKRKREWGAVVDFVLNEKNSNIISIIQTCSACNCIANTYSRSSYNIAIQALLHKPYLSELMSLNIEKWIVVTTRKLLSDNLRKLTNQTGWQLVVVCDERTPGDWRWVIHELFQSWTLPLLYNDSN